MVIEEEMPAGTLDGYFRNAAANNDIEEDSMLD